MKTTIPLRLLVAGVALVAAGCVTPSDALDGRGPGVPPPAPPTGLVLGEEPAQPLDLGDGVTLVGCEGDSPWILCLERAGEVIGTFHAGRSPIEPVPADPHAWLLQDAEDGVAMFVADREAACPGRTITPYGPIAATVAGEDGVLSGFAVSQGQETTDLTRSWKVAIGAEVLWFTVNAGSPDACVPEEGAMVDPLVLDALVAPLSEYVAGATVAAA